MEKTESWLDGKRPFSNYCRIAEKDPYLLSLYIIKIDFIYTETSDATLTPKLLVGNM